MGEIKNRKKDDHGAVPSSELLEALRAAAPGGAISCTVARKLAADFGVAPALVGRAADMLNIKIKNCELGCF